MMAGFSVKVEFDEEKFYEAIEEFKKNNPDFVEVVRCKDCKHWTQTIGQGAFSWELPEGECRNDRYFTAWQENRPITPSNHFCAEGERKGGDE